MESVPSWCRMARRTIRTSLSGEQEHAVVEVVRGLSGHFCPGAGARRLRSPLYEEATWTLLSVASADATVIEIGVQRAECSDGVTGDLFEPTIVYEQRRIVILARVVPNDPVPASCQGNDIVSQVVHLSEPVGSRSLIDGFCLDLRHTDDLRCDDQGVRWP